jgi:hypothetical protein
MTARQRMTAAPLHLRATLPPPPSIRIFIRRVSTTAPTPCLVSVSHTMSPPFTFLFQQSALSRALFALLLFFLAFVDACRPSSGAAVNFLFGLGGSNWKTVTGWSTPLTKAVAKTEFFGLKQSLCVAHPPCRCADVTRRQVCYAGPYPPFSWPGSHSAFVPGRRCRLRWSEPVRAVADAHHEMQPLISRAGLCK